MLSTVSNSPSNVPEFDTIYSDDSPKNFRKSSTNQQDFYSLQQTTSFYDTNFEIANRAFYATINKFTRQTCQNKRSSYTFLENWHLHSIYSKSQQTLLGINPVKPAVLLSGDDFMFTPPFVQQDEQYEDYYYENDDDDLLDDDEEDDWDRPSPNEFYSLIPCPNSTQSGNNNFFYFPQDDDLEDPEDTLLEPNYYKKSNMFMAASYPSPTTPSTLFETAMSNDTEKFPAFEDQLNKDTYWLDDHQHHLSNQYKRLNQSSPILSIYIPSQLDTPQSLELDIEPDSPEEPDLSPCSSYDEQYCPESSSDSSICSFNSRIFEEEQSETEETNIKQDAIQRSISSRKSLSDDTSSIVSYQSLADLINSESINSLNSSKTSSSSKAITSYGSTSVTANDKPCKLQTDSVVIEMGESSEQNEAPSTSNWTIFVYLMCLWQMLVKFAEFCFGDLSRSATELPSKASVLAERQPLL